MVLLNTNNFLNRFFWLIDGILTNTSTSDQSGPGSNGNEGVLQTSLFFRTGGLQSDAI